MIRKEWWFDNNAIRLVLTEKITKHYHQLDQPLLDVLGSMNLKKDRKPAQFKAQNINDPRVNMGMRRR